MAHFAKIENDFVVQVIVIANEVLLDENGVEQEAIGANFCHDTFGGNWVQTSYNNKFRGVFAGVGMTYDPIHEAFISPMPGCGHNELTLNELKRWECTNEEHNFVF